MEAEIKRVSYFDGQFLKEKEFNDDGFYYRHMRRRLNYVLFDNSGVVPLASGDLSISHTGSSNDKTVVVKAGTALSVDLARFEGKEIVLQSDMTLDLSAQPPATGTAWIAVNYKEVSSLPESSDFGGMFPTRITEQAEVRPFSPLPLPGADGKRRDPAAPNEELIVLGSVDYASMTTSTAGRQIAHLRQSLIAQVPGISVTPVFVGTGTSPTLLVTATGGFDLTGVGSADVAIQPSTGVSNPTVSNNIGTNMEVRFDVQPGAVTGPRILSVTAGTRTVSAAFDVQLGLTLTGFGPVNEPGGDTKFKINGTGFLAPVSVEFTKSGGGFTTPVNPPATDVTATQIRIDMTSIPTNAIRGPIRLTQGGNILTSSFTVTPPPVLTNFTPANQQVNHVVTINGLRFYAESGVFPVIGFGGGHSREPANGFPLSGSESLSDTQINVLVPPLSITGRITVATAGGTVQSSTSLNVI